MKFAHSRIVAVYIVCVWILPAHESSAQLTLPGNLIVSVTSPSDGSKVSNTITVEASVSPLGLVAGVQFKLDGADLGAEVKAAPYSTSWDTVSATNGVHKLTAVARNILDVRFTSDPVRVTVFNDKTPPTVTITSPANGRTVFGTVTVSAMATDNVGVAGVQFKLDGVNLGAEFTTAPYSISWDTTTSSNRSHILSAVARDAAGNQATATVNVVVFNDTTPPTVTITSPANGRTVFGTVTVSAMATDNVGVAGVQFKLDGVNLGAEFTTAPYSISWDTTTSSNRSHILRAVARDAAGNQATATVNVVVFNDTTPPTVSITFPTADSTVFGLVNVTASASDNGVVAGVQFRLDGDDLGVEATAAPYAVSWDTTRSTNGSHTLTAIARDGAGNRATSAPVVVKVSNENPIVVENRLPGSADWQMGLNGHQPAEDVTNQIKGYASATSVNKGESITFYVTVNFPQTYTMDVYRIGWYQGLGGRLIQRIGPLIGLQQPSCPTDSTTGLIECNWAPAYTLSVPTNWTTGSYLVQLTNERGYQNYITFVVRDDARHADILYQQSVATYQAYNDYPSDGATGKSLYEHNSWGANTIAGTVRAVKVSFNRPYDHDGSGQFLRYEFFMVRWLEQKGYDVSYSTDIDTHQNSARLLNSKAFLSVAHDEYWSKAMYDGAERARDAGVNLGFFGANEVFWQIRFEPSAITGAPDRVMVCYKDRTIDPIQGPTTTVNWRDKFLSRAEQVLVGIQSSGILTPPNAAYVVKNASHWVYDGTFVQDGDSIPGIVGYEVDAYENAAPAPVSIPGTYTILSSSPYTDSTDGTTKYGNSSIYQAPSGAWVFAAGTISWSWGVDYYGIGHITSNVLDRFIAKPSR